MPVPDYQFLMLPVLRTLSDSQEHSVSEIRQQIASELHLTEEELTQRLASNATTLFFNRVGWAIQYLKSAGVIRAVRRGVYEITARGASLLAAQPREINSKSLRQFPEFREFVGREPEADQLRPPAAQPVESKATPDELMESSFQALREALVEELLDAMKNGTPSGFERIVVDLLVAMGYGGSAEDAGRVVGKPGDGGIDGVIKQDKLGLDAIYVQAKRWRDVVSSSEVMKFSGSLTKLHATRGVFITTSAFTKDALEFVNAMPQRIVLIDGRQLASLMIEHDVGVSLKRSYAIKRLDQDYFEGQ